MMSILPTRLLSIIVGIYLILLSDAAVISSYDECPDPSDSCMNEHNFDECLDLIDSGCDTVVVMPSSCPLQFICQTGATTSFDKEDDNNFDSCVSLYVYENTKCSGEPIREMTFSTWSQPGSPCCKLSETIVMLCIVWFQ